MWCNFHHCTVLSQVILCLPLFIYSSSALKCQTLRSPLTSWTRLVLDTPNLVCPFFKYVMLVMTMLISVFPLGCKFHWGQAQNYLISHSIAVNTDICRYLFLNFTMFKLYWLFSHNNDFLLYKMNETPRTVFLTSSSILSLFSIKCSSFCWDCFRSTFSIEHCFNLNNPIFSLRASLSLQLFSISVKEKLKIYLMKKTTLILSLSWAA